MRITFTGLHDVFPCAFPCLGLRLNLVETESALISALTQAIAVSRLLSCLFYFTLFLLNQSDRSHLTRLDPWLQVSRKIWERSLISISNLIFYPEI
jgi:hypothetical protein